jgi:hypothetical protein
MSLTKLSLGGITKISPARESLFSDIPTGDGNEANLFCYSVPGVEGAGDYLELAVVVQVHEVSLERLSRSNVHLHRPEVGVLVRKLSQLIPLS